VSVHICDKHTEFISVCIAVQEPTGISDKPIRPSRSTIKSRSKSEEVCIINDRGGWTH